MKNPLTSDPVSIRTASIALSLTSLWVIVLILAYITFETSTMIAYIFDSQGFYHHDNMLCFMYTLEILSHVVNWAIICGVLALIIGECMARLRKIKKQEEEP